MTHSANCLCGAIELRATDLDNTAGACHCSLCRGWGGGPLMTVECKGTVEILDAEENLGVFNSSEWAERGFCRQCGTHLFYRLKSHPVYHLPAGLFGALQPQFDHQVFIDEKPEWYAFANETRDLTGPEVFALFAEQAESDQPE